jgi:membrane protease YdiL (CAAX protease family)
MSDAEGPGTDTDAAVEQVAVDDQPAVGADDEGRTAAATAGLAVAAVALLAAVGPDWPGEPFVAVGGVASPLVGGLALVALLAFSARRHGLVHRGAGVPLAGVAAAGVVAASTARLLVPAVGSDAVSAGIGMPVALLSGLACMGLAVADHRGADAGRLRSMTGSVGVALGITFGAFVGLFMVAVGLQPLPSLAGSDAGRLVLELVGAPLAELGFVAVALAYVLGTDRGWEFVDAELPSLLGGALAVGATLLLLVMQFATIAVIQVLGLPSSSQSTMQRAAEEAVALGQPEIVLVLVPMMLFVVGPAEELLFRNVVQKRLYEAFDRKSAVLVAGLVFAVAHVLSYSNPNDAAVFVSLSSIFFISLLLGFVYEYTDNVVVPAAAHGMYNATLVLFLYVALLIEQSGIEAETAGWVALLV